MEEMLAKIDKVASNDSTAFVGIESDIKVGVDNESGHLIVDMIAHSIKTDENELDRMNVSYAAARSSIKNATIEQ